MRPCLFLDRDGIFNEVVFRDGAIHSPRNFAELKHYPGLEGLLKIKARGYGLVMITNQPDLERGIVSADFLEQVHSEYQKKYQLDAVYVCPFADNQHPWKKPNPGMFLDAAEKLNLDLARSYHLGDTDRDVEGAEQAGITPILWQRPYNQNIPCPLRVSSLAEVEKILFP